MSKSDAIFSQYQSNYTAQQPTEMTLGEYLELCKTDSLAYATSAERMLAAIGSPQLIDPAQDPVLSRIFGNTKIPVYQPFKDFFGMEDTIRQVVQYFKSAAQNLEEKRQVLYLLGPVGSAKSSLAERIKTLMEVHPIYILKGSPLNESPLGLFTHNQWAAKLESEFGIPPRYLQKGIMSPWAAKRLKEFGGDIKKFTVQKVYPSIVHQLAIGRVEPGDENNQDISALVGSVDMRKLEQYGQNDPDAYSYSGGLALSNRGLLEFVEMFKAPIKVLNPLLAATQDGQYKGTETIGAMPYEGIILAHSNESEWRNFKNNRNNEAFLDRVCVVKVPYSLRVSQEVQIYKKLIAESSLADAPCAPQTLEMLASFSVASRLVDPENSSLHAKLRIYDGENLREDPKAKSFQEYRDMAGPNEGMDGISTRWAFKVLSATFNTKSLQGEVEANPVHLLHQLRTRVKAEQFPEETEKKLMTYIDDELKPRYARDLGKQIQTAYIESYSEYGQNIFDRYISQADAWIQQQDYRDEHTGETLDRAELDKELQKIEKPAKISNPKDFRNEVVMFVMRARSNNNGSNPSWTSYEKLRLVIEETMFANTEDLLPVISFNAKASKEDAKKHSDYVSRMKEKGYSEGQVRLVSEWWVRHARHS